MATTVFLCHNNKVLQLKFMKIFNLTNVSVYCPIFVQCLDVSSNFGIIGKEN